MSIFLSDTFTDTANVLLENHTPDAGGAWVARPRRHNAVKFTIPRPDVTAYLVETGTAKQAGNVCVNCN